MNHIVNKPRRETLQRKLSEKKEITDHFLHFENVSYCTQSSKKKKRHHVQNGHELLTQSNKLFLSLKPICPPAFR